MESAPKQAHSLLRSCATLPIQLSYTWGLGRNNGKPMIFVTNGAWQPNSNRSALALVCNSYNGCTGHVYGCNASYQSSALAAELQAIYDALLFAQNC